jgi:pyrimidine operon attenuation protein/uracil phosphoribosyltransferase
MVLKEVLLTEREIEVSLDQICDQLLARHPQLNDLVLVGIRTRGGLSGRSSAAENS